MIEHPTPTPTPTPTYVRAPGVVSRSTRGFLVLGLPRRVPRTIVGSAAVVWEQLTHAISLATLAERVAAETAQQSADIHADVAAVLDELVSLGFVQRSH